MKIRLGRWIALCLCLAWGLPAYGQYAVPAQAGAREAMSTLHIAKSDGRKPAKANAGWEAGASLNFITSDPSLGGQKLKFTDLALFRLHGLLWFDKGHLFAGVDLLPKQPSYTDELVWQGALLGGRMAWSNSVTAWLRGHVGPHLDRSGYWLSAAGAVDYRHAIERVLFFEGSVGWNHTQLLYEQFDDVGYYVSEAFATAGVAVRERDGEFASWLNFQYSLPIVDSPGSSAAAMGGFVDAQPRLDVRIGLSLGVNKKVDLFVEYAILDRGDWEAPATTLPILNGGFDQSQLVFGFVRRFAKAPKKQPRGDVLVPRGRPEPPPAEMPHNPDPVPQPAPVLTPDPAPVLVPEA